MTPSVHKNHRPTVVGWVGSCNSLPCRRNLATAICAGNSGLGYEYNSCFSLFCCTITLSVSGLLPWLLDTLVNSITLTCSEWTVAMVTRYTIKLRHTHSEWIVAVVTNTHKLHHTCSEFQALKWRQIHSRPCREVPNDNHSHLTAGNTT